MSQSPFNPYQAPATDEADREAGPASSPARLTLANRRQRAFAAMIDGLLVMMITFPLQWKLGFYATLTSLDQVNSWKAAPLTAVTAVVWLALNTYFLNARAQTLGKVITHIQIVNYDDGLPAPLRRIVLFRYLPIVAANMIPWVGLLTSLDPLFIFRKDHRCIHDLIAGTVVVKVR